MQIRGAKRPERRKPSHELNRLQLAAELQFQNIAHLHLVGGRQSESLQPLLPEVPYRRRQAPS